MESKIEIICREKQRHLLDKYFPINAETLSSETIGEDADELPQKIETEYREYLEELWKEYSASPLILEEKKLRDLMTEADREAIEIAYKEAECITLWERITKTNHEDVNQYMGLLREYSENLLTVMRLDFLEEITGKHILNKTFED